MAEMTFNGVIDEYQALIRDVIHRIEARYGVAVPSAVRRGEIPVAGELDGMRFHFHGAGCTAVLDGHTVSWDWHEGGTDLLDPWQIARLTSEHPERYGQWSNRRALREHMQALAGQGLLESVIPGSSYRMPINHP